MIRQVGCSVLPGNRILCIASTSGDHLVEGHDAITLLELGDIVTNGLNNARNVVALVARLVKPFWEFPIWLA